MYCMGKVMIFFPFLPLSIEEEEKGSSLESCPGGRKEGRKEGKHTVSY